VAIPHHDADSAAAALKLALRIVWRGMVELGHVPPTAATSFEPGQAIAAYVTVAAQKAPLPNTVKFIRAAERRGIPWLRYVDRVYQFGYGAQARRLDGSFTDRTGNLATRIARNKHSASTALKAAGIPVPPQLLAGSLEACVEAARKLGYPVVVKPLAQDQGLGVAAGLGSEELVRKAFARARSYGRSVIVEKHVEGEDHRLLVVNGRMLSAALRVPGGVTGDGVHTVRELIDRVNADPGRGTTKRGLIRLGLDEEALSLLDEAGLTPDSVPAAGRFVRVRRTANISTGGVPIDVTDAVHPDNRQLAERAARVIGLDIAGVDLLIPDIGRSWRDVGGAVCEVNAQPGMRVHWLAHPRRDLNGEVLESLLEGDGRIPIAAITGTNGKTTTCQMLHRILRKAGVNSGVCTTQGTWIGDVLCSRENLSGHPGGWILLSDPTIEAAVIEMPRKGLIYFGAPFDRCDVAAFLNVQDDHVGRDGIETIEQMAELKAELLRRARRAVVVNGEDVRCVRAAAAAKGVRRILFVRHEDHPAVAAAARQGVDCVVAESFAEGEVLVHRCGTERTELIRAAEIPATMGERIPVNVDNALAAAAIAIGMGLPVEAIRRGLAAFHNDVEQNPGRFEFVDGFPFQVMVDFGHNPDGVIQLADAVRRFDVAGRKILVNVNVGNRHLAHVAKAAPVLAGVFDAFVCSWNPKFATRNPDLAGRPPDAVPAALRDALLQLGCAPSTITVEPDPERAIRLGIDVARPGDLLVILAVPAITSRVFGEIAPGRVGAA
jgi:cyanophycin synthetase